MGFWIYMLLFVLLIPITMVYFGQRFFKSPPKSINATFGYRTTMSMKNWETWKLAHTVCGRYWYCCGWLLLPLSVVPILFVIGRSAETIGYVGLITVFLQLVPMLCALPVTEHALRKKFDKNGMRKS